MPPTTCSCLDTPFFSGCEFATFRPRSDVDPAQLVIAATRVRDEYLRHQPGFLHHALLQGTDGLWADMLLTVRREDAERICHAFLDHAACRDYLALIEDSSTHLTFWSRIG